VPRPDTPGRRLQEVRTYPTMTRSLLVLADRLRALGVTRVVMEATSDYWKAPFYLLEAQGFEVWLVNARDVKHLPGRPKTDKLDAVWLCKVAERQMLRPSFVPPPEIRRLRDLTRYRADLVAVRTAEKQRVEKLLEDAQIKLSVVASDVFGVSGRAMLAALIAGERDPKALAQLARTRLRAKRGQLEEAFTGRFSDHHAFLLKTMLGRIDQASADIAELDRRIDEEVAPFQAAVDRLDEVTGVGRVAAQVIVAEVGTDMGRFPTPGHLASWAKFAPGSSSRPARPRARPPPGTATATWPGCWARPPWPPGGPTPSSASATGASPGAAAPSAPSSRSAAPSWSSSGTCWPTLPPASATWAPASTTAASAVSAPGATTSASSKRSATRSPWNPPPSGHPSTRLDPAPLRCAGCCRLPTHRRFSDQRSPRGAVAEAFVLVELRGFEPLTSAMRTQGSHPTTPPATLYRTVLPQLKRGMT
jgi:transposase